MKKRLVKDGIFYTAKQNGEITDEGIVDEPLKDEEEIRKGLIKAGIIENIVLVPKDPEGAFFTIDKDGNKTDMGIVNEMLDEGDNELRIREELIRAGVIREVKFEKIDPTKP